jgi:hypothetical protein
MLCGTPASTALLYGSENSAIETEDKTRIPAAGMNFKRRTAKYTWMDHLRNKDVLKEVRT